MRFLVALSTAMTLFAGVAFANVVDCTQEPYCTGNVVVESDLTLGANTGTIANAEVIVDVDEPLPESVTLPRNGGTITFTRKVRTHTADVDVAIKGTDGNGDPIMLPTSTLPSAPTGSVVLWQYKANRNGKGEVAISHTVIRPNATPYIETFKLIIK